VKPINWFGLIAGYTVLTLLCVFFIPSGSLFSIVRVVLSFVFVAFVPGYCLISFLFQESKLDFPERLVLSVALSFSLAGVSGLFLGLSPIGLNETSIVETVSALVLVLAALALLRKMGVLKLPALKREAQSEPQPAS
jgi:uncharacterized membrane protein